jgi:DUF1009 family protein
MKTFERLASLFRRRKNEIDAAQRQDAAGHCGRHSRFLPSDFCQSEAVTLLAGRGQYPQLCARRMVESGVRCNLIAAEDSSDEVWNIFSQRPRARFNPGQIGKLLKKLSEFGSTYAIMAGQIAPKRLFRGLKFDMTALRMLATLRQRNAESIFGALAAEIERHGVRLLDARSFMDVDMATDGFMTKTTFSRKSLDEGIRVAKAIAALNVGQGIVVRSGTVLAVEGFDGTDKMLQRCSEFRTGRKCFIKTSKPNQDFRFDVPVVGLGTLDAMELGGIESMAIESGSTILLNRMEFLAEADRRAIGIYGYEG